MIRCHCVALSLFGMLIAASVQGQRTDSAERRDRTHARAATAIDELKEDLRDARKLLADIKERKLREQLELLLARAALTADDLKELLATSPRPEPRRPITDEDFAKLLANIKDQSFDDDKVEFIETFVKGRPMTCGQATEILKTLSFDDGRIKAAVVIYPGLVDSENFFEVLKVFPFDSSRKKVMEAIRKK